MVSQPCNNFTSLNKAISKKPYPLPRIDLIANAIAEYSLLSFLDTHKGYHKILMAEEDEDKTIFVTPEGLFYYKCMPFRLKNTGADF